MDVLLAKDQTMKFISIFIWFKIFIHRTFSIPPNHALNVSGGCSISENDLDMGRCFWVKIRLMCMTLV
jgi:hypothetical protein